MNKSKSKAGKVSTKSTGERKKGPGRGGARPGSGRKPIIQGEKQQIHVDMPEALLQGMAEVGILNKTAYINFLIAKDLQTKIGTGELHSSLLRISDELANNF